MLTHRCPWCGEKIPARFFPHDFISFIANYEEYSKCPSCERPYKGYSSDVTLFFLITAIVVLRFVLSFITSFSFKLFFSLFLLILVSIGSFCSFRIPYARDYTAKFSDKWNAFAVLTFLIAIIAIILVDIRKHIVIYLGIFFVTIICLCFCLGLKYYHKLTKDEIQNSIKPIAKVNIIWDLHKEGGLVAPKFRIMKGEIFPACFMNAEQTPISGALCVVLDHLEWKSSHQCTGTIKLVLDDISEQKLFIKNNQFYIYHNYKRIAQGIVL